MEILATLQRVIPFDNAEAWQQQVDVYAAAKAETEAEEEA